MEAADVQVGFAQLLPSAVAAAVAEAAVAVVVVGAWGSHLMIGGGHIRLLQKKQKHKWAPVNKYVFMFQYVP